MAPIDPSADPSREVHRHGMALDPENEKVQCCHCGKVVSGYNRLQHHLGGIRGNVVQCLIVPKEVKEFFRESLLSVKVVRLVKEVGDLDHPGPPPKRRCSSNVKANGVQPQQVAKAQNIPCEGQEPRLVRELTSNSNRRAAFLSPCSGKEALDPVSIMDKRGIGRFFFENCIDFSAVKSPSFWSMMEIFVKNGEFKRSIPNIAELKGWILDDELHAIKNYVKNIKLSWPRTGCSVLLDGWTDHLGRSLVSVIVDCPEGPIYLRSADVSPSTKGADALQLFLEAAMEEVGIQNVVQIIAHTSSDSLETVGKLLIEKYKSLFWTVSATHCISLILDRISMTNSIKLTLDKAKTITKFMYSRSAVLKLLRRYIGSHDLVRPCKIKSAASFLTLENLLVEKSSLELMFASPEWLNSLWASSVKGKTVAKVIGDDSFWGGVAAAVKATIPLVRAISLISGGSEPHMGFIYETMDQVKETISEEFGGRKSQYTPFWNIIDEIWNTILHSPLHAASYFLNPRLYFTEDFYSDTEVVSGLLITVVRMVEDRRAQDMIIRQIDVYGGCKGDFKMGTENNSQNGLSAATWWSRFGSHCLELQKVAIRILSQTCNGAESYGLRRDLAEKLLSSTGLNITEQQQLHDLTYLHYNLQLKQSKMGAKFDIFPDEIDPSDDWIVDELYHAEVTGSYSGTGAQIDTDYVSTTSSVTRSEEGKPSIVLPKKEPTLEI